MRNIISILLLFAAASLAGAQLSGYSTPETIKKVSSKAALILASPNSLEDVYHSASLLHDLKSLKGSCKCDKISSLLKGEENGMKIFYGIEAGSICGCPLYKASAKTKDSLISDSKVCITKLCLILLTSILVYAFDFEKSLIFRILL